MKKLVLMLLAAAALACGGEGGPEKEAGRAGDGAAVAEPEAKPAEPAEPAEPAAADPGAAKTPPESGPTVAERIEEARRLANAGDLDPAEAILRDVDDPAAFAPLALVLLAKGGSADEAVVVAERAAQALPDDPEAARTLVVARMIAGRYDEALAAIEAMGEAGRNDSVAMEALGAVRARNGDRAGAIEAFERALELAPGSATAHRNLAALLFAAGRREEGLDHLEAALATAAGPESEGLLGVTRGRGDLSLVTKGAGMARGWRELAFRKLAAPGDRAKAIDYLERSLRADPTDPTVWAALARLVRMDAADPAAGADAAAKLLEEGARAVGAEDRPALLLRLAVLRPEATSRVPESSPEGKLLARVSLDPAAPPPVPVVRPEPGADRYAALAAALFGADATAKDRGEFRKLLADRGYRAAPAAAPAADDPAPRLVELPVPTPRGVRTRFVLVRRLGADAVLVDDPDPLGLVVLPAAELAAGLEWRAAEGADPAGEALATALARLESGKGGEALAARPEGSDHAVAVLVSIRAGGEGLERAERAVKAAPDVSVLRMLLAEARLVAGDLPGALEAAHRAEDLGAGREASLFLRRLDALGKLRSDAPEAGFEALEAIRREQPDYLPVYEDLAGHYLARGRFAEAVDVLRALAERAPEARTQPGFREALKQAELGLAANAVNREELGALFGSEEPEVRRAMAMRAGFLPYADACAVLGKLAADPDETVRATAVRVVGEKGFSDAMPAVRARIGDGSRLVRAAVARTIRLVDGREGASALVGLLDDPELYVRQAAVNELRALSGRRFGYDPEAPEAERREAARRWAKWATQA